MVGLVDKTQIGKLIITKEVGVDRMKDITGQYKFQEGNFMTKVNNKCMDLHLS